MMNVNDNPKNGPSPQDPGPVPMLSLAKMVRPAIAATDCALCIMRVPNPMYGICFVSERAQ
jgi:hypothetical protein